MNKTSAVLLSEAILDIQEKEAIRADIITKISDTHRGRLEILLQSLNGLIEDIPDEVELFDFKINGNEPVRLWIDPTSFVRVGSDGKTYQLIKDTIVGRVSLADSKSVEETAEAIVRYVADRIVQRQKIMETDWLSSKFERDDVSEQAEDGLTAEDSAVGFMRSQSSSAILKPVADVVRSGVKEGVTLVSVGVFLGFLVLAAGFYVIRFMGL